MYNCSGTANAPYVNIKEGPFNRKHCPNNIAGICPVSQRSCREWRDIHDSGSERRSRGEGRKKKDKRPDRVCDEKLLITAERLNILRRCIFHIVTIGICSSDLKVKNREFCSNRYSFSHPK